MQNQIPKNWQKVKLGNYAKVKGGKRLPKGHLVQNEVTKHPYLRVVNMNVNGLDTTDIKYIPDSIYKKISRYTISDEDLYISIAGTIGLVGKIPESLLGSNLTENCAKICNFDNSLDRDFLLYFLRSYPGRAEIAAGTGGTSQPKLALYRIENFQIPLPPIEEQKYIASVLSAFDDKIEVNNKIAKTLEEMAQAIFEEWFVNFRFPGYERVKFVESELGKIPEGWEIKNLGGMMEFAYGKALKEGDRKDGNILVVGSSGVVGKHDKKLVSGPGIVIGRKGTVGSVIWIDDDFYPIDTTFYIKSELNLQFCYLLLRKQRFITGDSAVPGLNRNQACLNRIVVPTRDILQSFENMVKPMFERTRLLKKENQKLAEMRDLILPKLMRGEVRV